MFKKLFAFVVMLYAAASFAAVDVNKATAAELDGIKGIGPAISAKIMDERKKGNFKDWNDLIERVKGVGETNAVKFSAEGLTVGGAGFKGVAAAAPAAGPAKKDEKPAAAKAPVAAAPAAPAATATAAAPATAAAKAPAAKEAVAAKDDKKDPKAEAMAKKEADAKAKADEKMAKADAAKAKKDMSKDAKPMAQGDKKDATADSAKPAASAAKK